MRPNACTRRRTPYTERIYQMSFVPSYPGPEVCGLQTLRFILNEKGSLLVKIDDNRYELPGQSDIDAPGIQDSSWIFLGLLDNVPCYGTIIDESVLRLHGNVCFEPLRRLFGRLAPDLFGVALRAEHITYWDCTSRFCGRCGASTRFSSDERAKVCSGCGFTIYPRLSPAVIVAVVRDGKLLLANSTRFPSKFFSVIAGFVDVGETLEECVAREVMEETGIEVKEIRYHSSQPWPFPDSLMVGFTAKYARGEILVDHAELSEAGWFGPDELPQIPDKLSIARRLIDWFIAEHTANSEPCHQPQKRHESTPL